MFVLVFKLLVYVLYVGVFGFVCICSDLFWFSDCLCWLCFVCLCGCLALFLWLGFCCLCRLIVLASFVSSFWRWFVIIVYCFVVVRFVYCDLFCYFWLRCLGWLLFICWLCLFCWFMFSVVFGLDCLSVVWIWYLFGYCGFILRLLNVGCLLTFAWLLLVYVWGLFDVVGGRFSVFVI